MKIWVDSSTGVYGLVDDLIIIDTEEWTESELISFEHLSDVERSEFASDFEIIENMKKTDE